MARDRRWQNLAKPRPPAGKRRRGPHNDVLVHRRRHPGGAAIAAVHDDRFLRMGRSVDRIRWIGVRAQQLRKERCDIYNICEGPRVVAKNWSDGEEPMGAYQSSAKLFLALVVSVVSAFRLPHSPSPPSLLMPFRVAPSHPATLPTLQCTNVSWRRRGSSSCA